MSYPDLKMLQKELFYEKGQESVLIVAVIIDKGLNYLSLKEMNR